GGGTVWGGGPVGEGGGGGVAPPDVEMFTGIVEEMGTVVGLARGGGATRLSVKATVGLEGSDVGASVAVNGACLTVVERRADRFVFELGPETLARTMLGRLQPSDPVNLERPLRFGARWAATLCSGTWTESASWKR